MRRVLAGAAVFAGTCWVALAGPPAVVRTAPDAGVDAGRADASPNVVIRFETRPSVRARVYWGRELLGETPFELTRPRDSGPLDVVVRAWGYLPVHTRAYTFEDDRVVVDLTPVDQKHKVYGYKQEIPEDAGVGGDAGATTTQPATAPASAPPARTGIP